MSSDSHGEITSRERSRLAKLPLHVIVAALSTVPLLLGACGGSRTQAPLGPDAVAPARLVAADVGELWTQGQGEVFSDRGNRIPSIDPMYWCPASAPKSTGLAELAGPGGAIVSFEAPKSDHTSHVVQEQIWSDSRVTDYATAAEEVVRACTGAAWTDPDGNPISMGTLTGPKVGDQRAFALVTLTTSAPFGSATWRIRLAVVRVGVALLLLQETDVQPAGSVPLMSDTEWSALVSKAAAKVSSL